MNPNFTFKTPRAQANIEKIRQKFLLSPEDMEVSEVAALLFMTERNVSQYVEYLRGIQRLHVGSWRRRTSWGPVRKYRWGPGKDAPRPEPYTKAELSKRHRKANPERAVDKLMQTRKSRLKPQRDPLTSALFGAP